MNRTAPSSRLVRTEARSPARSSAGPDVTRRATPISAATMPARLVLPRPGGPARSRWSTGSPRRRAASSRISRCWRSWAWPTNSASRLGRSPTSSTRSPGAVAGVSSSFRVIVFRSLRVPSPYGLPAGASAALRQGRQPGSACSLRVFRSLRVPSPYGLPAGASAALRQGRQPGSACSLRSPGGAEGLEGLADERLEVAVGRQVAHGPADLLGLVAEGGEGLADLGAG